MTGNHDAEENRQPSAEAGFSMEDLDRAMDVMGMSNDQRSRLLAYVEQVGEPSILYDETILNALSLLSDEHSERVRAILGESKAEAAARQAQFRAKLGLAEN